MNKIYEPLKEKIRDFDKLKIEVFHAPGGMNYFSGQTQVRGVKLLLQPVSVGDHFESSIMMGERHESGFAVVLEQLNRRNQKKEISHFERIKPLSKRIVELYESKNYGEILTLVGGQ